MRFSSRAGDATKFEKIASPARAKNRSCGRSLSVDSKFLYIYFYQLHSNNYNFMAVPHKMLTLLVFLAAYSWWCHVS